MNTLYEKSTSPGKHKIESDNVLLCKETGRVIAVFYNDYDLDELLEQHEKLKEFGGIDNCI